MPAGDEIFFSSTFFALISGVSGDTFTSYSFMTLGSEGFSSEMLDFKCSGEGWLKMITCIC